MRLFLLPINSRNTLLYAQRINKQLTAESTWFDKFVANRNKQWLEWEAKPSGWQKKVTEYGNKAFARISYQEWGLKSVPPLSKRKKPEELTGNEKVEVFFPTETLPEAEVPDLLRRLATERQTLHRQRLIGTIVAMPFSIPFALIPIIPNLPFFYLVFRAYSHWRALEGSMHVTYLLDNKLLSFSRSSLLQKIYDVKELPQETLPLIRKGLNEILDLSKRAEVIEGFLDDETSAPAVRKADTDALLATKSTGRLVGICFDVPEVDIEMERAIDQVKKQVSKITQAASIVPEQEDQSSVVSNKSKRKKP